MLLSRLFTDVIFVSNIVHLKENLINVALSWYHDLCFETFSMSWYNKIKGRKELSFKQLSNQNIRLLRQVLYQALYPRN